MTIPILDPNPEFWTLIQSFEAPNNPQLARAVDEIHVRTEDVKMVLQKGGLLLVDFEEAVRIKDHENYPPEVRDLLRFPAVKGAFTPLAGPIKLYSRLTPDEADAVWALYLTKDLEAVRSIVRQIVGFSAP